MHQIVFSTKRTFHGFLRGTRKLLASFGLTAARFDLLYVVQDGQRWHSGPRSARQSDIVRKLGVTRSVVSRMVRSLEALGLVTREVAGDARTRTVTLTEKGTRVVRAALHVVLRTVDRLVTNSLCHGYHLRRDRRLVAMATLEDALWTFRRDFGDRATLYFPWGHPDD